MRRTGNTSGRNHSNSSGGSGDRAQTDRTLEERETEYAKARARIFNENPASTSDNKQTASNNNSSNNTNNGSGGDSNVSTISGDVNNSDVNNINPTNTSTINSNITTNKDQQLNGFDGINSSTQKRNASNTSSKPRRGFPQDGAEGMRKYADAGFSDMSFYSQDIATYRDKVTYNPKDQTLSLNDGGFMMDGKDRYAEMGGGGGSGGWRCE